MLFTTTVYAQQDTLVKKKYLDSLKYQLSLYSLTSYNHLNMYDRAETEKNKLKTKLDITDRKINILEGKGEKIKLVAGLILLYTLITILTMDNK